MLGGTSQDNFLNHHQSAPPTAGGGGAGAHLEGYLNKKRTKLTYRKRWFVQEEHVLQYYQSQEDARWFQDLEAGASQCRYCSRSATPNPNPQPNPTQPNPATPHPTHVSRRSSRDAEGVSAFLTVPECPPRLAASRQAAATDRCHRK